MSWNCSHLRGNCFCRSTNRSSLRGNQFSISCNPSRLSNNHLCRSDNQFCINCNHSRLRGGRFWRSNNWSRMSGSCSRHSNNRLCRTNNRFFMSWNCFHLRANCFCRSFNHFCLRGNRFRMSGNHCHLSSNRFCLSELNFPTGYWYSIIWDFFSTHFKNRSTFQFLIMKSDYQNETYLRFTGDNFSIPQMAIAVIAIAFIILIQTSKSSTVINLKNDDFLTGLLITKNDVYRNVYKYLCYNLSIEDLSRLLRYQLISLNLENAVSQNLPTLSLLLL